MQMIFFAFSFTVLLNNVILLTHFFTVEIQIVYTTNEVILVNPVYRVWMGSNKGEGAF